MKLRPREILLSLAMTLVLVAGSALLSALSTPASAQEPASEEIEFALEKPLASRSLLLDGAAIGDLMVAVGERGHILVSRDQGLTWKQATTVPTRATLTGVFFHDEELGWAVGHDAVILRTRDGGSGWELLYQAPEEELPFLDVWFKNAQNGFALGAYGYFLATSDGGDSWEPVDLSAAAELTEEEELYGYGADYHLNHIARSDDGRLYIAAEAGTIYRSDDGGESWTTLPSPYHGSFFGTLPLEGNSVLLFGLRGHLFRSDDAGESWREIDSGTQAMLTDGLELEDGTVVLAGLAGTLLVSADGGETFTLRPQADRQGLATILPTADSHLLLIGEFGVNRLPLSALETSSKP
jgi:photosystem II stability/assembly factor-like uncharacterized protein